MSRTSIHMHNIAAIKARAVSTKNAPLDIEARDGDGHCYTLILYLNDHGFASRLAETINEAVAAHERAEAAAAAEYTPWEPLGEAATRVVEGIAQDDDGCPVGDPEAFRNFLLKALREGKRGP